MSRRSPHRNQIVIIPELVKQRVENKPHAARFFFYIANILYIPFYQTKFQGTPPFHRPTLVALILYGLYKGNFSADKIIDMAEDSIGATWILKGMSLPSAKTIGRVINNVLENIDLIFNQVIKLCEAFELIGKERFFIDGTKTKANASKHKAMSFGYLCDKIDKSETEIEDLMKTIIDCVTPQKDMDDKELKKLIYEESKEIYAQAKSIHRKQLQQNQKLIFGSKKSVQSDNYNHETVSENQLQIMNLIESNQDKEVLEEMESIGHQASRLETMTEAKDKLEDIYKKETDKDKVPEDKQINFTDPESQIMVTKHNGVQQCYNNFGVVDDKANIIVGTYTTNDPNDKKSLIPTIEDTIENIGTIKGITVGADAGFFSADNINYGKEKEINLYTSIPEAKSAYAKDKFEYDKENDIYICPEDQKLYPPKNPREGSKTRRYKTDNCLHCEAQSDCTRAKDGIRKIIRDLKNDPIREQATEKAKTEKGIEILTQRKSVPEPVWGNMQKQDGLIQLHYRGLDKADKEFKLRAVMHNLRKLLKVFINNPEARKEIENMGTYHSQALG